MKRIVLRPTLSLAEAETRFKHQYVREPGQFIEKDTLGVLETGELKFLFLRNRLPSANHYLYEELRTLRFKPANVSRRAALRGSGGGELMMGWFRDTNAGGKSRLAVASELYPVVFDRLALMSVHIAETMEEHVPDLWRQQIALAKRNRKRLMGGQILDILPPRLMTEDEWPLFSTVAINHNTTCRAHTDAKNERGFACIATFDVSLAVSCASLGSVYRLTFNLATCSSQIRTASYTAIVGSGAVTESRSWLTFAS